MSKPSKNTQLLRDLFRTAIDAADPMRRLATFLPQRPKGRTIVLGGGKAAARMAQAVELAWADPVVGMVVTRYGHGAPCRWIEVIEASHPVPDRAGVDATKQILARARAATGDDLVLTLISGGGSALLAAPAAGITLADKQKITADLLRSGAPIDAMNCVRRHISMVKGGALAAAAAPARIVSLMISDIPGDLLADIASGPTVGDDSAPADAIAILAQYGVTPPASVARRLAMGESNVIAATDARLARVENRLIASPAASLHAAAEKARDAGVHPVILGDALEGEARSLGAEQGAMAREHLLRRTAGTPPLVLLSGGETTVTVRGFGRGGRNVEYLLALALALDGAAGIWAIAGDTDGVDGREEVAGALISPDTLSRARAMGIDPLARLDDNDGHGFFEALGDQVITGPTLTNVNDFRAILIV